MVADTMVLVNLKKWLLILYDANLPPNISGKFEQFFLKVNIFKNMLANIWKI